MTDRRRMTKPVSTSFNALVASAARYTGTGLDHLIQNREWQREGWDFYHAMGEFWYGVTWKSNALSRVRLVAAKLQPGGGEPEILGEDAIGDDKIVVDAVERLCGGVGGQSAMIKDLSIQLEVPGEGWLVGEQRELGNGQLSEPEWSVKSADEIRRRNFSETKSRSLRGGPPRQESAFEIQVEEGRWRPLGVNSLVCRIWQPDAQYSWKSMSATLPALPILRELDLYNRRIIAEMISRLASNGLLIYPEEAVFPTRPEFKDAPDPFIEELIDAASKAIKNPGSAAAAIPMPVKVPAALADKFVHLKFSDVLDPKLIEARDRAIRRLAVTLDMPEEVLTGVQNVNHWTAWQIDESGIKIHISPMAEVICHGLTIGYLRPTLEAQSVPTQASDGSRYLIWYDASELTTKPDLAANAEEAHQSGTISDTAYRREKGFSEDDAPTDDELKTQLLRALVIQGGADAAPALLELTGVDLAPEPPPVQAPGAQGPAGGGTPPRVSTPAPAQGPPPAGPNPPMNGKVPAPTTATVSA